MSYVTGAENKEPVFQLGPGNTLAEQIQSGIGRLRAMGHPAAYIVELIARGIEIETLKGQALTTPIADNSVIVGKGQALMREADFFLDPYGKRRDKATVMDGLGNQVYNEIKVNGKTCPKCGNPDTKVGYALVPVPNEPDLVVMCSNCGEYLWLQTFSKEGWE